MVRLITGSLLYLTAISVQGQGKSIAFAEIEQFKLFTSCQPIYLIVYPPRLSGLTEEQVRMVTESRLKASRLHESDISPLSDVGLLRVSVQVREETRVTVSKVEFLKPFSDQYTSQYKHLVTWERASYTVDDANLAMQEISELMNYFISEYLRVNKSACEK